MNTCSLVVHSMVTNNRCHNNKNKSLVLWLLLLSLLWLLLFTFFYIYNMYVNYTSTVHLYSTCIIQVLFISRCIRKFISITSIMRLLYSFSLTIHFTSTTDDNMTLYSIVSVNITKYRGLFSGISVAEWTKRKKNCWRVLYYIR